MSFPIQPTNQQNSQNTAVENQSVGQFGNQVIAKKDDACIKGLPEKVRSGFSLGRSIGRAWRVVKESVSAFFRKLFGKKSKAPTGLSGVEMTSVRSPKYKLVDVPGDGHCGVWAVLAGMGAIDLSECIRPQHSDYGGRPIATSKQKEIMITLRKRAEQEALKAVHTNPSAAGCAARLGLRDKSPTLETVDFQYIAQAIGRPIVVSQYQGNVEVYRTICDPKETEPTSLFREDFNNQQLRQGNPIRLYFDGGHYQLMQPIKTS